MPHIAPSTWLIVCFFSFFMISIVMSKLSWSFLPSFPNVSNTNKFSTSWPWN